MMKVCVMVLVLLFFNAVTDLFRRRISRVATGVFALAGVFCLLYPPAGDFLFTRQLQPWSVSAGICFGIFLIFLSFATGGAIGTGDGLIAVVMGMYLGFYRLLLVFTAGFFLSGVTGAVLIAVRKAGRKTRLPFIPFLFLASAAMFAAGI